MLASRTRCSPRIGLPPIMPAPARTGKRERPDNPIFLDPEPPLPNGAYLRPEDTNLPAFHLPITESRADAEHRLKHSISSFFRTAERVLTARKERQRRRDAAIEAAMMAEGREGDLTAIEKAAITRKETAEVAAEYGFPGKTIPQPARQLETGSQGNGKTDLSLTGAASIRATFPPKYRRPWSARPKT